MWPAAMAFLLIAASWQSPLLREHPLAGRIVEMATGRVLQEAGLVERLAAARFVLLGERHDNPDHHALQAAIVRGLVAAGRRPAIAFEMLPGDDQPAVARYLAGAPTDAAGLGPAVEWQRSGWPDWSMYRPIADVAVTAGLPIIAANLSRADTRRVRADGLGGLEAGAVTRLGLDRPLPPEAAAALADEIRDVHCGHGTADLLDRMVVIQRARDAQMADRLAEAGRADGAVLIAGSGHVRNDRGVPFYLARRVPDATIATVAFVEVSAGADSVADYAGYFGTTRLPFDYVWFTARVDDVDHCAAFRKSEPATRPSP
jgi:uncharacterized iron-regulated protein